MRSATSHPQKTGVKKHFSASIRRTTPPKINPGYKLFCREMTAELNVDSAIIVAADMLVLSAALSKYDIIVDP